MSYKFWAMNHGPWFMTQEGSKSQKWEKMNRLRAFSYSKCVLVVPKKTKSFNGLIFKWLPNSVNKIKNGQNSHHKSVNDDLIPGWQNFQRKPRVTNLERCDWNAIWHPGVSWHLLSDPQDQRVLFEILSNLQFFTWVFTFCFFRPNFK